MANTITFNGIDYGLDRIHKTKDYKMFTNIVGNRKPKLKKELLHAIERLGQLSPMIVNEHFQVVDGQHRLIACQSLGIEVNFIIIKLGDDSELVTRLMNSLQNKWSTFDYINYYAENGDKDYDVLRTEWLTRRRDKNRGKIRDSIVGKLLAGRWELSYNTFPKLRDGNFHVYSISSYNDFVNMYHSLLNNTEEVNLNFSRNVQVALYSLWAYKDFDTQHFFKACEKDDYRTLVNIVENKSEDKNLIFKQLLELYNEYIPEDSELRLLHPDVSGVKITPHYKSLDDNKVNKRALDE